MRNGNRWFYLLIGMVGLLFAGVIYAWSILKTPLADTFGWSASALAMNFTLTMCCFCLGGILASVLRRRLSVRAVLLLSAVMSGAGFLLTSRLSGGSIAPLYVSYGVLSGLGIGMAYTVVLSAVNPWFPDKKGLCAGALMMSFGISSLLLGQFASWMIGSGPDGWRTAFVVLAAGIAAALVLCAAFLRVPGRSAAPAQTGKSPAGRDYTSGEMLRRSSFWRFFLYCILVASVGNTLISFARDLALSMGMTAALAATMVGVLSVCNGLGRILCGLVYDGLGQRKAMLMAHAMAILGPALTLGALALHAYPLGLAGMCVAGLSYGCCPTISAAFVSNFYGMKHYASNYSLSNTMLIPASFVATLASVLLSASHSYTLPFVMLLVFAAVGLLLNLSLRRP